MNSITNLLDLEDTDIEITDIQIQGQTKTLTLSTPPVSHFCPSCGFRMYSRGIKKRTINHPILQDNYSLVLILKQRRWRCTNPECLYDTSESFKFVNRQRRTTNATDMLIVDAYRNLLETSVSIAKKFHVSDSHAHDVFNRYVKLDRLEKYKSSIINSFIMVEKIGNGRIYDSRLSNGPIESINRKIKDLKRLGRGFRNFEHFRNRFLYATRSVPVLNDITNYNPVLYLEEDDF